MAKPKKNETAKNLEKQLIKAMERVFRTEAAHEAAVDEFQMLLDKWEATQKDELWKAVIRSDKSYDEILWLINTTDPGEEK